MPTRTTRYVVYFSSAFSLDGFDEPQPAGEYQIEQDEEQLDSMSSIAYRRVGTFMHLPAITTGSLTRQVVPINPDELETALAKDRAA